MAKGAGLVLALYIGILGACRSFGLYEITASSGECAPNDRLQTTSNEKREQLMSMREHFGLTDEAYSALQKAGVTDKDLLHAVPLFDPNGSGVKISLVSLYYYVDENGDWREPPKRTHKRIAQAVFDSLSLDNKTKFRLFQYIEDMAEE